MKKYVNPQAIEIQRRFFQVLEIVITSGKVSGLKTFCDNHNLNRVKYQRIKMDINKPIEQQSYKLIDLDALTYICNDFGVKPDWLLLGRGKMFSSDL